MKKLVVLFAAFFLGFTGLSLAQQANEQIKTFGEFVVYYNAFNGSVLTPEVARQYRITRAGNRGVVNIAIRKGRGPNAKAVAAVVKGKVRNLLSQSSTLDFRKIEEKDAIYYIATFRFDNADKLRFNLTIQPDGDKKAHDLTFNGQFYVD